LFIHIPLRRSFPSTGAAGANTNRCSMNR